MVETRPKRQQDINLDSLKTKKAKTLNFTKTPKKSNTYAKRTQDDSERSVNMSNFTFNLQLQRHLHHRPKRRRRDAVIKLKNAKIEDQNLWQQNKKQTSRDDHQRPVEARFYEKLPGNTPFRQPCSSTRACSSIKDREHRQGARECHSFSDKTTFLQHHTGKSSTVLGVRVLDTDMSVNHFL